MKKFNFSIEPLHLTVGKQVKIPDMLFFASSVLAHYIYFFPQTRQLHAVMILTFLSTGLAGDVFGQFKMIVFILKETGEQ